VKGSATVGRANVSPDGHGVVSHAGAGPAREVADPTGLSSQVTTTVTDTYRGRRSMHRGLFTDLAAAVADSTDCVDWAVQAKNLGLGVFRPLITGIWAG
jgi:hypothetical protein